VPLVVRDPRPEADEARGSVVEAFSEAIDVMPTMLEWLGRSVPRACDGRSLLSLVRGVEPADWRQEVYFEHDFRTVVTQRAERALGIDSDACSYAVIRDRQFKYVHFAGLPPLLFDMENDPDETTDLAGQANMAATVLAYARRMLDWRLRHADRTLTNMALTKDGVFSRP
jgi:arylsulfatase A-like enzyme